MNKFFLFLASFIISATFISEGTPFGRHTSPRRDASYRESINYLAEGSKHSQNRGKSWLNKRENDQFALCASYIIFEKQRAKLQREGQVISCVDIRRAGSKASTLFKICEIDLKSKPVGLAACEAVQKPRFGMSTCNQHCGRFSCSNPPIYWQCQILNKGSLKDRLICPPKSVRNCLSKNPRIQNKSSEIQRMIDIIWVEFKGFIKHLPKNLAQHTQLTLSDVVDSEVALD